MVVVGFGVAWVRDGFAWTWSSGCGLGWVVVLGVFCLA